MIFVGQVDQLTPDIRRSVLTAASSVGLVKPHALSMPSTAISVTQSEDANFELKIDKIRGGPPVSARDATGQSEALTILRYTGTGNLTNVLISTVDGRTGATYSGEIDRSIDSNRSKWEQIANAQILGLRENPLVRKQLDSTAPEERHEKPFSFWTF